jgi:hypothetical protein
MTNWTKPSVNSTNWSDVSKTSTSYEGREVQNLGAVMDDEDYIMDDTVLIMDDEKFSSVYAPPTTWT